jgi:hypothetical protein
VTTASNVNAGSAVVTDGKFTNIYVYRRNSDKETWEQHMAKLRPMDAAKFSRASIDKFSAAFMRRQWPSYFDALFQYSGIRPPRFFGSAVATKACVDAALKDEHNGVLEWDSIRSLSNCHIAGMDPSPQVTLIFSPDIKIAKFGTGPEMCTTSSTKAWHSWGLNTPNFIAMPTSTACMPTFDDFTALMSHEIVETISDPAGAGMGDFGMHELSDNCENRPDAYTTWNGYKVERYWSNFDNNCQPHLEPWPEGAVAETWILAPDFPPGVTLPAGTEWRFTGDVHSIHWKVGGSRVTSDAEVTHVLLVIQTGGDNLRGGKDRTDNADATLQFIDGRKASFNINWFRRWGNGETHAVPLALPLRFVSATSPESPSRRTLGVASQETTGTSGKSHSW